MDTMKEIEEDFEDQPEGSTDTTTHELPGSATETLDSIEGYAFEGYDTKEECLLNIRRQSLLKLRKAIADGCTTLTFCLVHFLACIPSLDEASKRKYLHLVNVALETIIRFGTPDETDCLCMSLPFRSSNSEDCVEWCSNPYLLEQFESIVEQLESGVKAEDYEDIAPIIFTPKMVHPRGLTPKMVLLNRWINTTRNALKEQLITPPSPQL